MELFLFDLGGGILHLFRSSSEREVRFTPLKEPSVYSIYGCRVLSPSARLGGFELSCGDLKAFLPFEQAGGLKTGDLAPLQVKRERIGKKPPKMGALLELPLPRCAVRVEGKKFEGCPDGVAAARKLLKGILEKPKEGELLKWFYFYPRLGEAKVFFSGRELLKPILEFSKTVGLEPRAEELSPLSLASKAKLKKALKPLLEGVVTFDGGRVAWSEFEGFNLFDVNSDLPRLEANKRAAEAILNFLNAYGIGGVSLIDFLNLSPSLREGFWRFVKALWRGKCRPSSLTPSFILELICPRRFVSLKERLTEGFRICGGARFSKNSLFKLFLLEELARLRRSPRVAIRVNPLRAEAAKEAIALFEGRAELRVDPSLGLEEFELTPLGLS